MCQIPSLGVGMISNGEFLKKASELARDSKVIYNNKKIGYYNLPAGFDIETSSFYQGDRVPENKRAIMYIWMFGIKDFTTFGRTWDDFIAFLSVLNKVLDLGPNKRLVVYVHNLPYEFQFIRKRLDWDKVFILKQRKPVYAITNSGIEFRCSLKLAGGKSLANVAEDLTKYKVKKMVGFLDYSKVRTAITPLSKKELLYCEHDILVILAYIQEKIEQDGDITKIPLTNTGYVREYCRKSCYERWRKYRRIMKNLTMDPAEYSQLKRAFNGGFTHANANYVKNSQVLHDVWSDDFGSSYPGVMVTEKFPMSPATLITNGIPIKELKELLITKCAMFDVEFFDIEAIRNQEHPISRYKCWVCENALVDNGRIVMASHIVTTITEQDFFTILDFYTFDRMIVKNLRTYEKNYLPTEFVKAILGLYEKKTKLKGVEGEEVNYMISKNMINASFGMAVTDPVRDEIVYSEHDEYIVNRPVISEAVEKYNDNIRRFLFYAWGVWITAYARANLFSGIAELGDDYIYSDTDSVKYFNRDKHIEYFQRYNQQIVEKIKKSSKYHGIDESLFSPFTANGKQKIIGVWENEGKYELFKTLGAKRYLTFRMEKRKPFEEGGLTIQLTEPHHVLTLAGAHKTKTMGYLLTTKDPFKNFDNGLTIPPERSGRLTLTYIDEETEGDIVDVYGVPYHYHELSSVHMEPSEYNLSMSEEFTRYLEGVVDFGE